MPAIVSGHKRWIAAGVGVLLVGTLAVLAAVSLVVPRLVAGEQAVASPTPQPSTAAPQVVSVEMPLRGDCLSCHLTSTGVGTKPIPVLAHPVEGWRDCTACHSTDRLVQTAPGHVGIHADQCLYCHKTASAAAPSRPHPSVANEACLQCHGTKATLPASMAGRPVTTCWLCHPASSAHVPTVPHTLSPDRACRSCHSAGKAQPLPASHAERSDATCTACHTASAAAAPAAPHDLSSRAGMCSFCHGPSAAR